MDVTTPLLQPALPPRSYSAYVAGASLAAVSLTGISAAASFISHKDRLPFYAAEAICGTGLAVSSWQLLNNRHAQLRIAHAQTVPMPHFSLMVDQEKLNDIASTMVGLSTVLGAAAVSIGAMGAAFNLPSQNTAAAVGVGVFNLAVAVAHFYNQVHTTPVAQAQVRGPVPQEVATALASVV